MIVAIEPRGLREVNRDGIAQTVDGTLVPVAHGGGNVIVENMLHAQHAALVNWLGPRYSEQGLAYLMRDRGKRFLILLSPDVSLETAQGLTRSSENIYAGMPSLIALPDGTRSPIYFPRSGNRLGLFQQSLSFAAVQTNPTRGGPSDALVMRDLLVAPLNGADGAPTSFSVLDIAKDIVDGKPGARADLLPAPTRAYTIWTSGPRYNPSGQNRRDTR
jgi:hypothetical protein